MGPRHRRTGRVRAGCSGCERGSPTRPAPKPPRHDCPQVRRGASQGARLSTRPRSSARPFRKRRGRPGALINTRRPPRPPHPLRRAARPSGRVSPGDARGRPQPRTPFAGLGGWSRAGVGFSSAGVGPFLLGGRQRKVGPPALPLPSLGPSLRPHRERTRPPHRRPRTVGASELRRVKSPSFDSTRVPVSILSVTTKDPGATSVAGSRRVIRLP